ncbi:MAG: imidazole glycerol phosphate synthase subunit HisH [SAR324 cluster bacterium]|uniref:Imidazole glycerol phosphate synthase subunit HisH n=1 Tax=SAR324 cluster bacterium TaxID=2024889 RepID=A0A2A4T626_9DELT|nr:MAG: imidazole glycerol phosphate synthase subunit HisH [SAR324 cluster bacterium]
MIGIINYRVGNLQNLENALNYVGAKTKLINTPEEMEGVEKIVFPGVGAFGHAAKCLREHKFWEPLQEKVRQQVPILGICVGMQLLFSTSFEDGEHEGLGLVPGEVKRFDHDLKVPQMGWNRVAFSEQEDPLFKGIKNNSWFYFVHSYACYPQDPKSQLGTTDYGGEFCSIARKDNLWGVQFHPEKSQDDGLHLLKNFVENC